MNKIYKYIHIYTVKNIKGTSLNSVIVQNSCLSISNFCYFTEYLHYIYYMIIIKVSQLVTLKMQHIFKLCILSN